MLYKCKLAVFHFLLFLWERQAGENECSSRFRICPQWLGKLPALLARAVAPRSERVWLLGLPLSAQLTEKVTKSAQVLKVVLSACPP